MTGKIIECAYRVHRKLGIGFLEKVYENALRIELVKEHIQVKQQEPLNVWYENHIVGELYIDLLIENRIIIELKAVQSLVREHEVQLVNCLTATYLDIGLLYQLRFIRSSQTQAPRVQSKMN